MDYSFKITFKPSDFFRRDLFRQETLLYLVGDSSSKSVLTLTFILIFHKYRKAMLKKSYQLSG